MEKIAKENNHNNQIICSEGPLFCTESKIYAIISFFHIMQMSWYIYLKSNNNLLRQI